MYINADDEVVRLDLAQVVNIPTVERIVAISGLFRLFWRYCTAKSLKGDDSGRQKCYGN